MKIRHRIICRIQKFITSLTALGIAASLSGCSEDEARNYAVPEDLCGVTVEAGLIEPFLPPGNKISIERTDPVEGITRCRIEVDGQLVFQTALETRTNRPSLRQVADGQAYARPKELSKDRTYLFSDRGAVSKANCAHPQEPGSELFTIVQVTESGLADKQAMPKLITAYTRAVSKSKACSQNQ